MNTNINQAVIETARLPLVLALPKGRVMAEALPLLQKMLDKLDLSLPADLLTAHRRDLITELPLSTASAMGSDFLSLKLVEVKNWDVISFVASGAADAGIVGRDIWEEKLAASQQGQDKTVDNLYAPLDLKIGHCRLSVAGLPDRASRNDPSATATIGRKKTIASKYPHLTQIHYQQQGQAVTIVPLSGSLELAPRLGMADDIVDLVATGQTLRDNGLVERATIMPITSLLIINRVALKTNPRGLQDLIARLAAVV